jgi:5-methylcytosine-specific restriction endonuclease McrA
MPGTPYQRKGWRVLRQRVLERDNYECQIRGPGCTTVATQADHFVPINFGGARYDETNVRASCEHCNKAREYQGRNAVSPGERGSGRG